MSTTFRAKKRPCDECPWRRDATPGRFTSERFRQLQATVRQDFAPLFACHKTEEGQDVTCAGYLLVEGENNFVVRLAIIKGRFDPESLSSDVPLYDSYREMALINGVREEDLQEEECHGS